LPAGRASRLISDYSPGQSLPNFPGPTHGSYPLPPFVTVADAISDIRPNDPMHDIRPFPTRRFSSIDPSLPFPGTIMASSNTQFIYPDGTRPFSKREIARFQTFSDAHVFGPTRLDRQSRPTTAISLLMFIKVGNAVPPLLARRIFESVIAKLKETE